jgi:CubicO group peptidase (beta-lactamase class C family)
LVVEPPSLDFDLPRHSVTLVVLSLTQAPDPTNLEKCRDAMADQVARSGGVPSSITLLSCLLVACATPHAQLDSTAQSVCDVLARRYVEKEDFSGVIVMANRSGEVCRAAAGDGISATTVFPVGSLTKQLVSVAVLRAQEQGRLKLQDDVGPWLEHEHSLRVVELMNHTSGLPDFTKSPGFLERRTAPKNGREVWEIVRSRPLRFEPGTRFEYSNSNYLALGLVLEHVYGESLESVLAREVLAPAGMRETMVNQPLDPSRGAVGTEVKDDPDYRPEPMAAQPLSLYQGAGGAASTADDLVRFARSFISGAHLRRSSEVLAVTDAPTIGPNMTYALGWIRSQLAGREVLWHTGSLPGFSHRLMVVPSEGLIVVALSNRAEASLGRPPKGAMGDALFAALVGQAPVETSAASAPQAQGENELGGLAGTYVTSTPSAMRFEIDVVKQHVYLRVLDGNGVVLSPRRRIDPVAPGKYVFPRLITADVRFEDPGRLVFHEGNETIVATRERQP